MIYYKKSKRKEFLCCILIFLYITQIAGGGYKARADGGGYYNWVFAKVNDGSSGTGILVVEQKDTDAESPTAQKRILSTFTSHENPLGNNQKAFNQESSSGDSNPLQSDPQKKAPNVTQEQTKGSTQGTITVTNDIITQKKVDDSQTYTSTATETPQLSGTDMGKEGSSVVKNQQSNPFLNRGDPEAQQKSPFLAELVQKLSKIKRTNEDKTE